MILCYVVKCFCRCMCCADVMLCIHLSTYRSTASTGAGWAGLGLETRVSGDSGRPWGYTSGAIAFEPEAVDPSRYSYADAEWRSYVPGTY